MKTQKKPVSVLDDKVNRVIGAAFAISEKRNKSWFDKLKPVDQKWVRELKAEYLSGNHPNLNATLLSKALSDELGIDVSGQAMRMWLRKTE